VINRLIPEREEKIEKSSIPQDDDIQESEQEEQGEKLFRLHLYRRSSTS
jgi:hypothetical protein